MKQIDVSPATTVEAAERPSWRRIRLNTILLQLRAFIALIVVIIVFSILSPSFLNASTLTITAEHVAINAILATGMTFVILTGGIDLSVGSIVGLTGMIAGGLLYEGLVLQPLGLVVYFNVWMVILVGLLVGVVVGAINGLIITRLGVPPFITTLGTLYIARGLAELRSNGDTFPDLSGSPDLGNTGFETLGSGSLLGVPIVIWLMIVFAVVAAFVASRTPFGRQVYAIGGNERAARLSGVRVMRVKFYVYVISGFCAAMPGLIIASQLQAAQPAVGETFELNAIAAVVLGGTSLMGGRGTIMGSLIGAFVIGVLSDGMVLIGVSEFWQNVTKGAVIIIAVVIDQVQQRLQNRPVA
jgi:erythritol transport system permease protein